MPDFETSFQPDNDVVYGTGDWIHVYLYNFWFTWPYANPTLLNIDDKSGVYGFRSLNPYDPSAADRVDQVTASAHNKYGINVINNYNLPIKSNIFKADKTGGQPGVKPGKAPEVPKQDSRFEQLHYDEYFRCLETSVGYGPGSLMKSAAELKDALKKYQQADTLNLALPKTADKLPGIVVDIAIRRSCKFGIHYFVERKNARLHYILDGMNIQAIVDKDRMLNSSTQLNKVPICTSEIRYIFRHWNRLGPTGRLLFYTDFDKVGAPWVNAKHMGTWPSWADYAIARLGKHHIGVPAEKQHAFDTARDDFQRTRNQLNASAVITAFHDIPSACVNDPKDDTLKVA
ncbi:MAG: hypothetical protein WBE72_11065 [Terracidiphilus sp.]